MAAELKSTPAYAWVGGKFDPANLAEDVAAVRKYYESLGFFDAKITPSVESSKEGKWIHLRDTVQEGLRYRIRDFGLAGNTRFKTGELLKAIKTNEGQYYDAFTIRKDIETIKRKYDLAGYSGTTVVAVPRHLHQPGVMDLVLRIDEGKVQASLPIVIPVADLVLPLPLPRKEETNVGNDFGKLSGLAADTPRAVTVQAVPRHLVPGVIGLVVNDDKPHGLRSYPVADLVLALPGSGKSNVGDDFEKLIELVTDTVQPNSWQKTGGQGLIVQDEKTLSLVIQQTPAIHRQVLAFLRSLRSLRDWQVCLELALIKNPPADFLRSLGTSGHSEGKMRVHPLTEVQRTKLLNVVRQTPDSMLLLENVTMFYGTRGSIGWAPKEKEIIDFETADSTDRYAVNLRFGLHDNNTGKAMRDPLAVTVANLKAVVIEFHPIGAEASAKPSLLVVRPRLLFPLEEEEVRQ